MSPAKFIRGLDPPVYCAGNPAGTASAIRRENDWRVLERMEGIEPTPPAWKPVLGRRAASAGCNLSSRHALVDHFRGGVQVVRIGVNFLLKAIRIHARQVFA
jgi:hypothetical protein